VILDYIREHGDDNIGGMQFVGGVSKLGSEEAMSVLMPQFVALVPGFFASDVEQSVSSLQALIRMCVRDLSEADLYLLLGASLSVPPHVRQAMLSRVLDNDDVLRRIRTPALLTHGTDDAVVSPAAVDRHKAILAHAQVHMMPNTGHAPFWDEAAAFNRRLRQFAASL
jgi:pimeloyl-ACP methyl ester carboxylesterase